MFEIGEIVEIKGKEYVIIGYNKTTIENYLKLLMEEFAVYNQKELTFDDEAIGILHSILHKSADDYIHNMLKSSSAMLPIPFSSNPFLDLKVGVKEWSNKGHPDISKTYTDSYNLTGKHMNINFTILYFQLMSNKNLTDFGKKMIQQNFESLQERIVTDIDYAINQIYCICDRIDAERDYKKREEQFIEQKLKKTTPEYCNLYYKEGKWYLGYSSNLVMISYAYSDNIFDVLTMNQVQDKQEIKITDLENLYVYSG